jgi:hypothetical protein
MEHTLDHWFFHEVCVIPYLGGMNNFFWRHFCLCYAIVFFENDQ